MESAKDNTRKEGRKDKQVNQQNLIQMYNKYVQRRE